MVNLVVCEGFMAGNCLARRHKITSRTAYTWEFPGSIFVSPKASIAGSVLLSVEFSGETKIEKY